MKNRRALSSIVGTVFAIIALGTTIGYITYSMGVLEKFNEDTLVRNIQSVDTNQENFDVVKASIVNNRFDITVQNSGNIPINITRLWVKNTTATNWVYKYDLNTQISPGGTNNLGQNLALTALDTKSYDMKMITQRGNTKEFLINSPTTAPLDLQLHAIPNTVPGEFTTTLILAVTNNMSNKNTLLSIVPTIQDSGDADAQLLTPQPIPPQYDSLASGDTAFFKWVYKMTGTGGQTKTFTASLQNPFTGNTVSDTVTIEDVGFSIQSGTAIESQGLSTSQAPDEILILHQETTDAATGRQMYSGAAENPTTLNTPGLSLTFFSKNDTQQNVVVGNGKWNATLRMISNAVPDGITAPNLIYHFEESGTTVSDSSGNGRDMTAMNSVSNSGNNGRDGTKAFQFAGTLQSDHYLQGPTPLSSGIDDIKGPPDSTSGWFKTTGAANDNKKIIYRVGSDANDYYEIALGDGTATKGGYLYFKFNTKSGMSPNPAGDCHQSTGSRLDDGNWHHFVAVRDGSYTCKLYIDGNTNVAGTTLEDTSGCSSGCSGVNADYIDPVGRDYIGKNPDVSAGGQYFPGYIDDVFHWNSYTFPSTKVGVFYNTNYGANAHHFQFSFDRTKSDGNAPQNIAHDDNYAITFWDGKGSATAWSAKERNYTTSSLSSPYASFARNNDQTYGDRLKFTMKWVSGLNMSLRIDDPNLNNPLSTFIQVPSVTEAFPSYYILDNDNNPVVNVYNEGPYGSWVTYLTRITLDDIASTNAYAGQIRKACGTTVDKNNQLAIDSPLIKVGVTCALEFEKPSDPPNAQGTSPIVTPGQYRMYVFMSGYDETGNIFLRTTYVGLVRVVD